jgi:hypothetical protein
MSQSRNAACSCGSGLKFKRCCGSPEGKPSVSDASQGEGSAEQVQIQKRAWVFPVALELVVIAIAVAVGLLRDSVADSLAVGMALSMAVVVFLLSRNAPVSTGRGSSTAINFGVTGRRSARKKNRKNRRR